MTIITFDTLKVANQLEQAGYSAQQAKVQATILADVLSSEAHRAAERFATKSEFTQELVAMRSDLNALGAELKILNSDTKAELVRWVVGVGVLQMALIAALVLKLVH